MSENLYEVISDGAMILKRVGTINNPETGEVFYENESIFYPKGTIINESDISPTVIEDYNNGDEHVSSIITCIESVKKVETEEENADDAKDVVVKLEQPVDGYDSMNAPTIIKLISESDAELVSAIEAYEKQNKNRSQILKAII